MLPGYSGTATASPSIDSVDARMRAAYNLAFGDWYVRPFIDFDLIHTHSSAYDESGPTTISLAVKDASQTTFVATPAVELGKRVDLTRGVTLRPFVMGGVSFFSDSDWRVSASFTGAPAGAGAFTTTVSEGSVAGRVGAGVQVLGISNLDLRLQYDGECSGNRVSNAGFLTAAWRF